MAHANETCALLAIAATADGTTTAVWGCAVPLQRPSLMSADLQSTFEANPRRGVPE